MNRYTGYSFLLSFSIHLAALTFAFIIVNRTSRTTTEKISFTEVSFRQIQNGQIKAMIKKIEKMKNRSAVFTVTERVKNTTMDRPVETGRTPRAISKIRNKIVKTLKSKKYKKDIKIDAASSDKDLFFQGEMPHIDINSLSGNIRKGRTLKDRQSISFKKEIEVKAVNRMPDVNPLNKLIVAKGYREPDIIEEPAAVVTSRAGHSKIAYGKGMSFPEAISDVSNREEAYDEFSSFDSSEIQQRMSGKPKEKLILDTRGASGIGITIVGEIGNRKILKSHMPEYPAWLTGKGIEPVVVLRFTVLPDGRVKDTVFIKKTSGFWKLDKLVISELKKWIFMPLSKESIWKEEMGEITFKFSIR